VVPPVNAEYLHERLPTNKLDIIDAGHFIWEDAADTYATLVTSWWAGGYAKAREWHFITPVRTADASHSRRGSMAEVTYDKEITALLVVDPCNDFITEGGKLWSRIRAVAEANDCVPHMLQVLNAARNAKLRVFYALHHRYRPGDYETWKYMAPIRRQLGYERPSNSARGMAKSVRSSSRSHARLSPRSIGVPVVSPTQI
jgi:hypothetical protein